MFLRLFSFALVALLVGTAWSREHDHPLPRSAEPHPVKYEVERKTEYWINKAQDILAEKLRQTETVSQ
ncbi:hypothetical protein DOY81_009131 [Sarcophaga bullata]|nr:hypothetical protein DOY81_009131 [Sarcophaga bullata]